MFPFCGHENSFYGDLHVMDIDGNIGGMMFCAETKAVTAHWFDEVGLEDDRVDTWEGTISRA